MWQWKSGIYPSTLLGWWCHGINRHVLGNILGPWSFYSWIEVRTNAISNSFQLCTSTTLPTSWSLGPFTWGFKLEVRMSYEENNVIPSTAGTLAFVEAFERLEPRSSFGIGTVMDGRKKVLMWQCLFTKSYHTSAYITLFQSNLRVNWAPGIVTKRLSEEYWLWGRSNSKKE